MLEGFLHLFARRSFAAVLTDLVDILVVTYVIYRALLVLRGTRAMQMGTGLGVLLIVFMLARWASLTTLIYLLGALLASLPLIVVVIFQNDIRRGLMRVGARAFLASVTHQQESKAIDEVVAAATELARHRVGALIAFEQDANLDEFVVGQGTPLDASVQRDLLVSLFLPESLNKLHDGAVIIRNLRIAKAGVFFPMPDTKVHDKSLGSRHRAALGITEETDAVVVVVSEERGSISFCFNGNIVTNLDGRRSGRRCWGYSGSARESARASRRASARAWSPRRAPAASASPFRRARGRMRRRRRAARRRPPAPATCPPRAARRIRWACAPWPRPSRSRRPRRRILPRPPPRRRPPPRPCRVPPPAKARGDVDVGYQLRALVTENVSLKLISLVFALMLYSLVHGSQEAQRSIRVNVVALLPQTPNRVLVTSLPEKLNATVRGPRSMLDELNADDLASYQLDLRAGTDTRVTFVPASIPLPPGLKVEQVDPPAIDLTWEDLVARDVPVQVGIVGTPAPGYVVKGVPRAEPATVRVRGPKSRVVVMQVARADAFDVTGLTEGKYTRALAIDRPPDRCELDVPSVGASVEIGREVVERPFSRVAVAVVGRMGAKAQPSEVDVRLSCPADVVRPLRPEQLVPRVAVTSTAEHGSEVLPVQLTIDQCDVHLTPSSVVVRW